MVIRTVLVSGCIAAAAIGGAAPAWADCDDLRPSIPASRYIVSGGEAYDTQSDLTWQRCSAGQSWTGSGCAGSVDSFTFEEAESQVGGEWRLPTVDELRTLTSQACTPSVHPDVFPNMDTANLWYWSGDELPPNLAGTVYFDGGAFFYGYKTAENAVRLVRSGR